MATPKPKAEAAEPSKKVFDVSKPGKSTPDATARPIIVTNRPMLQDPMMANQATPASAEEDKLAPAKAKVTIKPITVTTDEDSSDEIAVKKKKAAKAPETKEPAEEPSQETPEEPAEPTEETELATKEPAAPEPTTEAETEQKPAEPSATEEPAATAKPEEEANEPEADAKPAVAQTPEQQDVAAKKADEEAAKHEAEVQKLVDDEKYFLPINTVESRKTKRFIIIGAVLIVVLGLAWMDVALDAGLIHISGVKALTHFFTH